MYKYSCHGCQMNHVEYPDSGCQEQIILIFFQLFTSIQVDSTWTRFYFVYLLVRDRQPAACQIWQVWFKRRHITPFFPPPPFPPTTIPPSSLVTTPVAAIVGVIPIDHPPPPPTRHPIDQQPAHVTHITPKDEPRRLPRHARRQAPPPATLCPKTSPTRYIKPIDKPHRPPRHQAPRQPPG